MTPLKICSWNANGLHQHLLEVKNFLASNDIDVLLISETHLTSKLHFSIPGFSFFKTDHPDGRAHGGTGILIRNHLRHHEREKYATGYIQATSISLISSGSQLTLSAVYCQPRVSITEKQFKEFFDTLGDRFIAAGDYNAKHTHWGSRLINTKGKQLYFAILNSGNKLSFSSPGAPTYWPSDNNKKPDLIDFAIIKGIHCDSITAEATSDLSSDHSPVLFHLYAQNSSSKSTKSTVYTTDWLKYKKYISSHISLSTKYESHNDIDECVLNLNRLLISAGKVSVSKDSVTPIAKLSGKESEIKQLVNEKRRLRREWQSHRSPMAKYFLHKASKKLKNMLTQVEEENQNYVLENLCPNQTNNLSLWKKCKTISTPMIGESPLRTETGIWARSDEEKAHTFARHLKLVFQPNPISNVSSDLPQSNASPNIAIPLGITFSETQKLIKQLKTKKAPGYDKITPTMLLNLPNIAIRALVKLFNAIVHLGHFPTPWKKAMIKMIPKPGKDKTIASSYRPISLLPCISKLFERLFLLKILPYIQRNNLIPNHQFGFQAQHGTTEQVNRITKEIRRAYEQKLYCSAIFLDVAQAFDKVWHKGLIHKIKILLPINTHKLLASYLTNREFQVKFKSFVTSGYEIKAGVPQGSVLGPLLYVLYTADIPTSGGVIISTFADDTAIMCSRNCPMRASSDLQNHLLQLEKWLSAWCIKVNEQKSKHVTFSLRQHNCPAITLNGVTIPHCNEVTYLGIHLDRRLTWHSHLLARRTLAKMKTAGLSWLLNHRSRVSLDNKVRIYKSIIKPILIYGIQLWGRACTSNIQVIQRTQNSILRGITGAPWYVRNEDLHRDLQVSLIHQEINRYQESYENKLRVHPNKLARALCLNSANSRLKRKDLPPRNS